MSSLYNIQQNILTILEEVEQNEGVIEDSLYDELVSKQTELKQKLENYIQAVRSFEVDANSIKDEKKRFNDRQNVYKNRIEHLKQAMLKCVVEFGETGKSNKFIELVKYKLYTKRTTSIVPNEERINVFLRYFRDYITELHNEGILYLEDDIDLPMFINSLNAIVQSELGEDFEPFTISDFIDIKVNITTTMSIYDMLRGNGDYCIKQLAFDIMNTKIDINMSNDDWKLAINKANQSNLDKPTIVDEKESISLVIK